MTINPDGRQSEGALSGSREPDPCFTGSGPSGFDPERIADTYEDEGPKCPYCGRQYTADEGCYFDEQNYTEETCDDCGLTFDVDVYTSTTWTCSPKASVIEARRVEMRSSSIGDESAVAKPDAPIQP